MACLRAVIRFFSCKQPIDVEGNFDSTSSRFVTLPTIGTKHGYHASSCHVRGRVVPVKRFSRNVRSRGVTCMSHEDHRISAKNSSSTYNTCPRHLGCFHRAPLQNPIENAPYKVVVLVGRKLSRAISRQKTGMPISPGDGKKGRRVDILHR